MFHTINWGTRAGGGMGEEMETPDIWSVVPVNSNGEWDITAYWLLRAFYDFFFFLIIIIIIMNIVFGIVRSKFKKLKNVAKCALY